MSGALGGLGAGIATGVRLGQGVAQSYHALTNLLAGGDSPQPGTVQVGSVNLSAFACPESIGFGGTQMLTVHKMPGGARVLDAMGPDDRALAWSGILLGPDAVAQARALDLIRQQGVVVPVSWDDFDYDVIVTNFEPDYKRAAWVPYRIECTIKSDYSGPQPGGGLLGGLLGGTGLGGVLGGVGSVLGEAASTVGAVVQSAQQVVGAVASVVTPITSALGIHVPFLGTIESGLSQASGLAGAVGSAATGLSGLSAFQGDVSNVATLSTLGAQNTGDALGQVTDTTPLDQTAALAGTHAGFIFGGQTSWSMSAAAAQAGGTDITGQSLSAVPALGSPEDTFNMIKGTIPPADLAGTVTFQQNGYSYTATNGVLTGQAKL